MRNIFGKTIVELAEKDENIVLLTGDVEHNMDEFKKRFPARFFNLGLCEQSIISVAAGMAIEGLKPYVYAITPHLLERPFEQVKLDINQQNLNVKLIGYSDYPTAGPTHTELDGPGLSALLKNFSNYFPITSQEARNAMLDSYIHERPSFISLKRDKTK
ncbi:MAG: hypothetical protein Q8L27_01390 [archaeon]|nr:hypothetical protein [archaeon]